MQQYFQCGRYRLAVNTPNARPLVMGILNITPDSFSDGGQFYSLEFALSHAEQMIADGVDIIDIGAESSRPGSPTVSLSEELDRLMPIIYALRDCGKPLSIDTYKPMVMREAIAAGADLINDINAFRADGALEAVKESDCGLCVMHMQGQPQTMQERPAYDDVLAEVTRFWGERVAALERVGVERSRISIDPGFGFGKTLAHNLVLLRNIGKMQQLMDLPMLVGASRKTMIGNLTGKPIERRLAGSVAAALVAVAQGAKIVRVHDVAETIDALAVWQAGLA
ncbi:dihydropteroate synthase [Glaciimonas sp. Gout2]|uniref:dihydropteroate synthase n=1 Tax=unclassified Glaciimonas TaxID=2644401 RepID=UPI002B23D889|nr:MULTISPECIES: dihydropteroate synthase [unclassified Glaciimonas]MEB0010333.1 dihydropteroate synthase [Glaciimonas sp. Cout2]MEB0084616.1 dihydropteroate synthase [Glaciimonas sp. Gout2]